METLASYTEHHRPYADTSLLLTSLHTLLGPALFRSRRPHYSLVRMTSCIATDRCNTHRGRVKAWVWRLVILSVTEFSPTG